MLKYNFREDGPKMEKQLLILLFVHEFVKFDIVYENVLKISKMELKFDFMKDAQPKSRSLLASPIWLLYPWAVNRDKLRQYNLHFKKQKNIGKWKNEKLDQKMRWPSTLIKRTFKHYIKLCRALWSSGQRACLLLRRSGFKSCWSKQFLLRKHCLKRTRMNKKEVKNDPFINPWQCLSSAAGINVIGGTNCSSCFNRCYCIMDHHVFWFATRGQCIKGKKARLFWTQPRILF